MLRRRLERRRVEEARPQEPQLVQRYHALVVALLVPQHQQRLPLLRRALLEQCPIVQAHVERARVVARDNDALLPCSIRLRFRNTAAAAAPYPGSRWYPM